jgi:hypothetical protein
MKEVEARPLSITSVPISTLPPLASHFAEAMTNCSTWGQSQLMIEKIRAQKDHYASLIVALQAGTSALGQRIATLKKERIELEKADKQLENLKRGWRGLAAEAAEEERAVQALSQKSIVLETTKRIGIYRSAISGFASSSYSAGGQTPSTPTPRTSSQPPSAGKAESKDENDYEEDEDTKVPEHLKGKNGNALAGYDSGDDDDDEVDDDD